MIGNTLSEKMFIGQFSLIVLSGTIIINFITIIFINTKLEVNLKHCTLLNN